jgi:hypothetical protein
MGTFDHDLTFFDLERWELDGQVLKKADFEADSARLGDVDSRGKFTINHRKTIGKP